MKILVINAGSSSIKFQLFVMPDAKVLAAGLLERIGEHASKLTLKSDGQSRTSDIAAKDHQQGMAVILQTLLSKSVGAIESVSEITAVGHRVVHGGEQFTGSVLIDDDVIASIENFADLAPLHNPHNLTGIRAAMQSLPHAAQVACFDTAFHTTIPQTAWLYALPYEVYEKYRVRRYGFHGTSHRYVTHQYARLVGKDAAAVNIITCHLGNGCSITAVKNGLSVDTSMGFTPLEGLVMGTRTGDFDPAILFYLAEKGYSVKDLNDMCNKKSGLLGISGTSNDMRNLFALAAKGDQRAKLAIDIFCCRVKKYIGAYTAILGTLEAVVFTGGIGENAPDIRSRICSGLDHIGIEIDPAANVAAIRRNAIITTPASRVAVYVVPTDEETSIAQDTYDLVKPS